MERLPGQPARVDVQAVVQILSSKISALTIENAMLQARVGDLEARLQAEKRNREEAEKRNREEEEKRKKERVDKQGKKEEEKQK